MARAHLADGLIKLRNGECCAKYSLKCLRPAVRGMILKVVAGERIPPEFIRNFYIEFKAKMPHVSDVSYFWGEGPAMAMSIFLYSFYSVFFIDERVHRNSSSTLLLFNDGV